MTSLNLANNKLGFTLTSLNIASNHFYAEGAKYIGEAIKANVSALRFFWYTSNLISGSTAVVIMDIAVTTKWQGGIGVCEYPRQRY